MASQFEKRKAKEFLEKKRDEITKKVGVVKELSNTSYDVVIENGKYILYVIKYSPTTRMAEVIESKPVNREVGMIFQQKKTALKKLANI